MASLARIVLIGNVGRDAELRYTPRGAAVLEFTLAVNERWGDASAGQQQDRTHWFRCSLFGKQAETLKQYIVKGKQIFVEGRLSPREYTDREGKNRTSLDVKADVVQLLGGRGGAGADEGSFGGRPAELDREDPNVSDDDIPF